MRFCNALGALKTFDHTLSSLDLARRGLDAQAVAAAVQVLLVARNVPPCIKEGRRSVNP